MFDKSLNTHEMKRTRVALLLTSYCLLCIATTAIATDYIQYKGGEKCHVDTRHGLLGELVL